jgi:hypothetical protein
MLGVRDTLVLLIVMFNGIHFSNVAGNKKVSTVYTTIGNLLSKIRQMPSTHSVVMVGLQPSPIKNCKIREKQQHEQWYKNWEVLNEVLRRVFHPVTFKHNRNTESGYYNVLCADGNFRRCNSVFAARLADFPEYCDLHDLKLHVCFSCECPISNLEIMCLLISNTPAGSQSL